MHQALTLVARAIAHAHDHWRRSVGRRRSLASHIAVLEERVERLTAQNALLRARLGRVPARRRPRYRAHERLEILWHAARYRLSVTATAHVFGVTRQTIITWRRVSRRNGRRTTSRALGISEPDRGTTTRRWTSDRPRPGR